MSKKLLTTLSFISLITTPAIAKVANNEQGSHVDHSAVELTISPTKQALMDKLSKVNFFSASFTQKIVSDAGEILQQGRGEIAISKPNLVHWKTTEPDETLIISDGETLWFFDPFIEQATAYGLDTAINNTPILLLTHNDKALWQQYQVSEQAPLNQHETISKNSQVTTYIVTPTNEASQIKQLSLSFIKEQLRYFAFTDATGQVSQITLLDYDSEQAPSENLFTFDVPEGVLLEDKR